MKSLYGVLTVLSFFYLLGNIGAIELETVELGVGLIKSAIGLLGFIIFSYKSGIMIWR